MNATEPGPIALRRKRHWTRYSLRTLLLLMTVLALCLGRWAHESRQEKRALKALANRDFWYQYDYKFGAVGELTGAEFFRRVTEVHAITSLSDDDLVLIGRFKHLRHLSNTSSEQVYGGQRLELTLDNPGIRNPVDARISDVGLERLRGLSELRWLVLFYTRITDDGLRHLVNMKRLELLKIGSSHITDQGVAHLSQLTSLRSRYLNGTAISDVGVAELQRALPKCKIIR